MDSDITMQLMTMQAGATRQSAAVSMVRKAAEAERAVVTMIDDGMKNAPPPPVPGTGQVVDKRA